MRMGDLWRGLGAATVAAASLSVGAAGQETVELGGRTWRVDRGEVKAERVDGKEALSFRTARISLPDAGFRDGTLEFDLRTTGHRSFAGIGFRVEESGADYEYFYLRPHQTGRFDAMQYTPVDHGLSAWQIYAEHNAPGWIPTDAWLHVRLEVEGSALRVFLDDAAEPALTVDRMERAPVEGGLVLVANFPQQGELDLYPTRIADLRIRPAARVAAAAAPPTAAPGGSVERWELSAAFPATGPTLTELPAEVVGDEWEAVWTHDGAGRLNIGRHRARVRSQHGTTVLARTVIVSDREQVKRLSFGFSDRGSVFLNGRLLFTGDNTYLSRSERYLGVMTVDNDGLYLPLREGENELVVAVTEAFGGWGLVARLDDVDGVELSADRP